MKMEILQFFNNLIDLYCNWWLKLYRESPQHIFIETSLVIFIIWLLFIRRTVDPTKRQQNNKLNKNEINWLIETWKPETLASRYDGDQRSQLICQNIVVSTSLSLISLSHPLFLTLSLLFFVRVLKKLMEII